MEYINQGKSDECFICQKAKGDKEENYILYQSKLALVLLNVFPYNNGHLLLAPIRHAAEPEALDLDEIEELVRVLNLSLQALRKALNPEGFNIGANLGRIAGAGLEDHFHLHIVPRWQGDTNFMPVLAETKVMPEHLTQTYLKLKDYFTF